MLLKRARSNERRGAVLSLVFTFDCHSISGKEIRKCHSNETLRTAHDECSSEQGTQVFTNPLLRTITPGSLRVVSRDIALGLREPSASLLVRRSSNDVFGRVRVSIFWTVLLFLSLLRFLFILFAHSLSLKKYSVSRTKSEAFPSVFKILAHSLFFQQGRVALGKWCIGPQKGHHRTPGMDFFVQCQGLIFLPRVDLARLLRRAYSRSVWIISLEFVKVCGIRFCICEGFIGVYICCYPISTILACLFSVGVRISWKKLCWMRACRRKWHLVFPTLYIIIVYRVNLNKLLQIITKLRWSNKNSNN